MGIEEDSQNYNKFTQAYLQSKEKRENTNEYNLTDYFAKGHYILLKVLIPLPHKGSPLPPVPAKPNTLYSRGSFVDNVCWTVG